MSNSPGARAHLGVHEPNSVRSVEPAVPGAAATTVRAPALAPPNAQQDPHEQLRAQLREAGLEVTAGPPQLQALLRLVSQHYHAIDEERRGIAQSMRLMADEAHAMASEARQQSSEHLQVILDHIKDVVLTVDEDGTIRTFNPTGERVFGFGEAEVLGRRIDLLIPHIAERETIPEALQRLAATSGDTLTDLTATESWGLRKNGRMFPAEMAISHASVSGRQMFVVCLREVTER